MPMIHRVLEFIFPHGAVRSTDSWVDWFGQNQARFDFWIIYLAAICDDLGIPSIKTLGRWLWRKIGKHPTTTIQTPAAAALPRCDALSETQQISEPQKQTRN